MKKYFVLVLYIFYAATAFSQIGLTRLKSIDQQAATIDTLSNEHAYSYQHQKWRELVEASLKVVHPNDLKNFKPTFLQTAQIESYTLYYYIRPTSPTAKTIDWIAIDTTATNYAVFTDEFAHATANRLSFSTSECGFIVTDSLAKHTCYTMPDIAIRLAMETTASAIGPTDAKDAARALIIERLKKLLNNDEGTMLDLSGLPRLCSVADSKKEVRVVTFMTAYSDFTTRCDGLILRKQKKEKIRITQLFDETEKYAKSPQRTKATAKKWYGAVYYALVETTVKKVKYYTLLGYSGASATTKRRVIEPLWFSGRTARLGASIFEHERATYARRVFEYTATANMLLRYDDDIDAIVFDHLAPPDRMYTNEFSYYGPDFSYDCYEKTSKCWQFKSNVEMRNRR